MLDVAVGCMPESLFYLFSASKPFIAMLVHLLARLKAGGFKLLDTQFVTDHLKTFGAIEVPRRQYHELLEAALTGDGDFAALGPLTVHVDCDGMGVTEASYA